MNYRDEVQALHRWLEAGRLTACDIALWHALHDVAMLSGQEQGLAVAISTLEARTGFRKKSLQKSRDKMRDMGIISWKPRGGRAAAEYQILRFPDDLQGTPQATPQATPQGTPQPFLTDTEMDAASATYQQDKQAMLAAMERVGMQTSSYNAETALSLAATYGAQVVVDALEKAAQHDRRGGISWAFVKAILEKPQQPQKPKTRKIRETLVINGELVETVREVPYDYPVR